MMKSSWGWRGFWAGAAAADRSRGAAARDSVQAALHPPAIRRSAVPPSRSPITLPPSPLLNRPPTHRPAHQDKQRVNVSKLEPPNLTGGYLISYENDNLQAGEGWFRLCCAWKTQCLIGCWVRAEASLEAGDVLHNRPVQRRRASEHCETAGMAAQLLPSDTNMLPSKPLALCCRRRDVWAADGMGPPFPTEVSCRQLACLPASCCCLPPAAAREGLHHHLLLLHRVLHRCLLCTASPQQLAPLPLTVWRALALIPSHRTPVAGDHENAESLRHLPPWRWHCTCCPLPLTPQPQPPRSAPPYCRDPKKAGPEALAYLTGYLQSFQDALEAPDWLRCVWGAGWVGWVGGAFMGGWGAVQGVLEAPDALRCVGWGSVVG